MEFINLTRHVEIGANCYALKTSGKCVLLDSGMHPTETGEAALPNFAPVLSEDFDAVLLSHAHQDHVGSLPAFSRFFPDTPIFMTPETASIAEIMLHNSVNVMLRQREDLGLENYPLFTHRAADLCAKRWRLCPLNQPVALDGQRIPRHTAKNHEPYFEFHEAGHILGSTGIAIHSEGRIFFYTGDVNFDDQTILKGAEFPTESPDVLVMETTRGDAPLPPEFTRLEEERRFAQAVREAISADGYLLIPVFALGKTQEILAMLWKFRQEGILPQLPIYIGGLSSKITGVYDDFRNTSRRQHSELRLFEELAPYVLAGSEVQSHSLRKGCIYLLSSGMMTEHTLSNLLARTVLPDAKSSIFFVGYSDPASPAGKLRAAQPGEGVLLDSKLPPVSRNCRVESFQFSAHASRESLITYATRLKPKKILLVHGDPGAVEWTRQTLTQAIPQTELIVAEPGKWITL